MFQEGIRVGFLRLGRPYKGIGASKQRGCERGGKLPLENFRFSLDGLFVTGSLLFFDNLIVQLFRSSSNSKQGQAQICT